MSDTYFHPTHLVTEKLRELLKEKEIAINGLTRDQLAEAIRQAIACGDFTRYVQVENQGQSVVYIPYRRMHELLNQIEHLKIMLETHKAFTPEERDWRKNLY